MRGNTGGDEWVSSGEYERRVIDRLEMGIEVNAQEDMERNMINRKSVGGEE